MLKSILLLTVLLFTTVVANDAPGIKDLPRVDRNTAEDAVTQEAHFTPRSVVEQDKANKNNKHTEKVTIDSTIKPVEMQTMEGIVATVVDAVDSYTERLTIAEGVESTIPSIGIETSTVPIIVHETTEKVATTTINNEKLMTEPITSTVDTTVTATNAVTTTASGTTVQEKSNPKISHDGKPHLPVFISADTTTPSSVEDVTRVGSLRGIPTKKPNNGINAILPYIVYLITVAVFLL